MIKLIIDRARFLIWHCGEDVNVAIEQAMKELGDVEELCKTYSMFDITRKEIIESLKKQI